jgi:hypothetical protein
MDLSTAIGLILAAALLAFVAGHIVGRRGW